MPRVAPIFEKNICAPGAPKTRFVVWKVLQINLFAEIVFYGLRVDLCRLLEALGAVFLITTAWKQARKLIDFHRGTRSKRNWVAGVSRIESWFCKQLNSTWLNS